MTQAERRTITDRVIFHSHPLSLLLSVGAVCAGLAASVNRGGIALSPAFFTLLFAIFSSCRAISITHTGEWRF